ncbi:adenylate/guanylate cyclase domain-containing protein [candidate division KSB3 bacterium]|uniref:Adenylate/guanylate cyclase domain-containing protein n=1 Tax=candidate division KSB3 bacterium TaxID=2044937 RepID=A0A9D5JVJ7_9BACT|nr:adenylate/guanylate cyclase domain-containing protein [candidate division KSB3 bacterium]MBD3325059.1 adenylate/guanylate cyclase domain-containing protein [candidate division KSB3 bacterium]
MFFQPRPYTMLSEVERRLKGTPQNHILEELLTNSIHFPLANLILELLLSSDNPFDYIREPDAYVISVACIIQAYFLGMWKYKGHSHRLIGNLIGPTLYTVIELFVEGREFFDKPNHIAYWGFALAIGLIQEFEYQSSSKFSKNVLIILENLVRTNILLITYWIFTASHDSGSSPFDADYLTFQGFLSDHGHQYVAIVLFLLGLVIGFANLTVANYLGILQHTAKTLRRYSEWLFGRDLLSQAITDASVLSLKRRERTVLFMDIRGFTQWSEPQHPEDVVTMLNAYFGIAETLWRHSPAVIKVKYTGDEVMIVFSTATDALSLALQLRDEIQTFLSEYELSAGIGIHSGQLVEGLMGSEEVKAYDIIGDTVNTAKRICDKAAGGEILLSHHCYGAISNSVVVSSPRLLSVKGKSEALRVYLVQGFPEKKLSI